MLIDDLQTPQNSLEEFKELTIRILNYYRETTSVETESRGYQILYTQAGSGKKYLRPVNSKMFINNSRDFEEAYGFFLQVLRDVSLRKKEFLPEDYQIVDRVMYTIQQSVGVALDLLSNPNSARKHVGMRFEELVRHVITEIGLANKKVVLKIPYTEEDDYRCETDLVFSPFKEVQSSNEDLHEEEVVVSLKTSSKDRMGKIFMDKLLMRQFTKKNVKVIGIFLNDVQRKENKGVSYTFVAGLFMVYTKFLTQLDGVYFVDPPPNAEKEPYSEHVFRFSRFLLDDAYKMVNL